MVSIRVCGGISGIAVAAVLITTISSFGCTKAPDQLHDIGAGTPGDGLMLVFVRELSFDPKTRDIKDENRILNCVRDEIVRVRPRQPFVTFKQFRQTAFPDLQLESVPRRPEYFAVLLDSMEFHEAIKSLELRYVVFVGGVSQTSEPESWGGCGGGYGGVACLLYVEWAEASKIGATVLDLKMATRTNQLQASSSGKSFFAIVGIFPIGLPSYPSDKACKNVGIQVGRLLGKIETPKDN